jgi:hypothetical protein
MALARQINERALRAGFPGQRYIADLDGVFTRVVDL